MSSPEKVTIDYRNYDQDPSDVNNVSSETVIVNGIETHITDARPGGRGETFVVPRAFQAFTGDPFERQRDKVLAHALQARVIGIDTPGVGLNSDAKSSLRQKWQALHGRTDALAEAQVAALREILGEEDEPISFIGYSLGAQTVASMVTSPKFQESELTVGSISLLEVVNDQDWHLLGKEGLQAAIGQEDSETNRYLLETQTAGFKVTAHDRDPADPTKKIKKQGLPKVNSLLLGVGMRHGFANNFAVQLQQDRIRHSIDNPSGPDRGPITIYRANGSSVARPAENKKSATALKARFVELHPAADHAPHRHPIWHSMGAVGLLALEIETNHKKG